jgi:uncharacterized protein YdeI (YjbR/CyaY-like superfamily)
VVAQDGKTKAMRHWRFTSTQEIDEKLILAYIREAAENVEQGRVWKAEKLETPDIPDILGRELAKNKKLKESFAKLTGYKQNEYIEYIATAKRVETQQQRIGKITPMILAGTGLNDKYKK